MMTATDLEAMYLLADPSGYEEKLIAAQLEHANRRRRTRTLSINNCMRCLEELRSNPETAFTHIHGGTVASNYGYKSETTCFVAAKRSNGTIRWTVFVADAHRSTLPWRNDSRTNERAREWADNG